MKQRFALIPARRKIIDRRLLADELRSIATESADPADKRALATARLKEALASGRAELETRMHAHPGRGRELAASYAFLTDQLLRVIYDFACDALGGGEGPGGSDRLAIGAVGGYGRGEMAPYSDVDILFLTPGPETRQNRAAIEFVLYVLWDLGLKVGHATRSIDDLIRVAKEDLTVKTAALETRYIWGDQAVFDRAGQRFWREVVAGNASSFVADKLAERDERHKRMGDSRYVVEPNLKEGKGGLRDLHTLFWIGKFIYQVDTVEELVGRGLLTAAELRLFLKSEDFLWSVRCNLHDIVGRADERLNFQVQKDIAARLRYADRPGLSGVERFMRHYFLNAKQVGDLTGLFLAHFEDQFANRSWFPRVTRRPKRLSGFSLSRGRITVPWDDFFKKDPVRLIELFHLADRHALEPHPLALRQATRDASLVNQDVRKDPRANALFLDILTSPRDPEKILRWMNEAGVFGRFVPEFGRIVAQMQYDMYHHYTVDEHTIRAIGLLARIDSGALSPDHPLASKLIHEIASRRALYVAVLLHDIAKGRGGDHSEIGAAIALTLCPRFGLTAAETETVSWLVRYHLLMSATAFKRDLTDFKTVVDFAEAVKSPERLRLLLVLTVVDITAVGPGTWTKWKAQLLKDLFEAAEELLCLGHKGEGRRARITAKQRALEEALGWSAERFSAYAERLRDSYWIAETSEALTINARMVEEADRQERLLEVNTAVDDDLGATLVSVYAADHPGLFYRIAGAISLASGDIVGARIHTTRDGMALDNLLVVDAYGGVLDEPARLERLETSIERALRTRGRLGEDLASRRHPRSRSENFDVETGVFIDNNASNRFTVVEVNAFDRPALLYALTYALFQSKVTIHSAHIATYGERAVDVFYLTDLMGDKITSTQRLRALEKRLRTAAGGEPVDIRSAA